MTPKKIILLRHGQTDFNMRGVVQGSGIDSSLNKTGRAQAQAFYDSYKNYGFDELYTSALKRTHETVEEFIQDGLNWKILSDLNEISWGTHEGRAITSSGDEYYQWMLKQWQSGNTSLKIDLGESPEEAAVRLQRGLSAMIESPSRKILVCMHGRAMRILLCLAMNRPLSSMDLYEHQNACVYELHFAGSTFKILRGNNVEHLQRIKSKIEAE